MPRHRARAHTQESGNLQHALESVTLRTEEKKVLSSRIFAEIDRVERDESLCTKVIFSQHFFFFFFLVVVSLFLHIFSRGK